MAITSFVGKYAFLSNFFVEKDGRTVEHRFQAEKTLNDRQRLAILQADTPGKAKRLGRKCDLRPDWEEVKVGLMYRLLMEKFADDDLRQKLLATGDEDLVEGNNWNDTFWGVCKGVGDNQLGVLLMRVREIYREAF